MNLKGTKTCENLMKAFAGESQARNRYTYYASIARKEGYRQIEGIFIETADNEKEHAKRFFKHLVEGNNGDFETVTITADFPVSMGSTLENLKAAAAGENEEWSELYPAFADVAEEEGFKAVATTFRNIAKAEVAHEERYNKFISSMESDTVFKKDKPIKWRCRNCGYVHEGTEAVTVCPACLHKQEHFEALCENY